MLEMELPYRFFQTKFAKAQPGIRPNCFKQAEATTQRTLGNYERLAAQRMQQVGHVERVQVRYHRRRSAQVKRAHEDTAPREEFLFLVRKQPEAPVDCLAERACAVPAARRQHAEPVVHPIKKMAQAKHPSASGRKFQR